MQIKTKNHTWEGLGVCAAPSGCGVCPWPGVPKPCSAVLERWQCHRAHPLVPSLLVLGFPQAVFQPQLVGCSLSPAANDDKTFPLGL